MYYQQFWEICLIVCLRLSFLSTNSFAASAKFILSRVLMWICTNVRASSRLFAIVDLRYVFTCFKAEKVLSISAFVACESKSFLTISPTPLKEGSILWHILQLFNNGAHNNCVIIFSSNLSNFQIYKFIFSSNLYLVQINLAITLAVILIYWCRCPRC